MIKTTGTEKQGFAMKTSPALTGLIGLCLLLPCVSTVRAEPEKDYRLDVRLKSSVELAHSRVRLSELLQEVSTATGVPFKAGQRVCDDEIACIVRNQSAATVLSGVCGVMRYTIVSDRAGGYQIDLDPSVAAMVSRLSRDLTDLDEQREARWEDAIAKGIQRTLADNGVDGDGEVENAKKDAPELLNVLKGLSSDQLSALATGASRPFDVISATSSVHMSGRVYFAKPLSSFPAGVQADIRHSFESSPDLRARFDSQADPVVGIGAQEGCLGFSLQVGDEVYNATSVPFGGVAARQADNELGTTRGKLLSDLERLQAMDPSWRDPVSEELPKISTRTWRAEPIGLQVEPKLNMNRADCVLAEFARRAQLALIADSFSASTFVPQALALADAPSPAPSGVWARRIARSFQRKYRCVDGILELRSRRFVWDRCVEPPREVVENLSRAKQEQGRLELRDFALASTALSKQQTQTLGAIPMANGETLWREAITLNSQRKLLQVLAALPAIRDDSRLDGTASISEVPPPLRRTLIQLVWTGFPTSASVADDAAAISWRTDAEIARIQFRDPTSGARSEHTLTLGKRRERKTPGEGTPK
jgi:hypothetical protein